VAAYPPQRAESLFLGQHSHGSRVKPHDGAEPWLPRRDAQGDATMIKLIGLLKKKLGMSRQEFIDYYENHHVPLAVRITPMGHDYRRSYTKLVRAEGREVDMAGEYDVVSEVWFRDQQAYDAFATAMRNPEISGRIKADEEKFLDRSATKILMVEEHCTTVG
jgi:uncharacterized protein (TIGR02118 family)